MKLAKSFEPVLLPLLNGILWLLAKVPLPLNHALGCCLGYCLYYLPTEARRISAINIAVCLPQLNPITHQHLVRRSLCETGKAITELGYIWHTPAAQLFAHLKVHNKELLDQANHSKQGLIVLTPHLGSWELAGIYAGAHCDANIFYRPPKIKLLDQLIRRGRTHSGARLVTPDRRGLAQIIQVLKQGKMTGLLPDQSPQHKNSGVFVPFFKQPVLTMTLLTNLIQKTGAQVLFSYTKRLPRGRGYELFFHAPVKDIYDPDPTIATRALNQEIEAMIRIIPEQYLWSYKRFKHTADDRPNIYA